MIWHALIELGFGMVDSEVPVPQALIQVILTFEKRAFNAELRRKTPSEGLVKEFAGGMDHVATEISGEEDEYRFTSLGYEATHRAWR